MGYQIIATVELYVDDETALGQKVTAIKTFAANNNGTERFVIRTADAPQEEPQL